MVSFCFKLCAVFNNSSIITFSAFIEYFKEKLYYDSKKVVCFYWYLILTLICDPKLMNRDYCIMEFLKYKKIFYLNIQNLI